MRRYRRDGFRTLASRFVPQNPVLHHNSRICQSGYSNLGSKGATFYGFSLNPFLVGARRFYHVDVDNMQHFRQRRFHEPRNVLMVGLGVLISAGVSIVWWYFRNLQTVPYIGRTNFFPHSKAMERWIGEKMLETTKAKFKWEILPPTHAESVRVRTILEDIIDALQKGSKKEHASCALVGNKWKVEVRWHQEDEILDDKWVQQSSHKGQERGSQPATLHLDGLNWEVLVVNNPAPYAFSAPGGKIVVYTGLLEYLPSDAELAFIIGREVGHIVARHDTEWIIRQLLRRYFDPYHQFSGKRKPSPRPYWMASEADYIGLLLIALAGYDPRTALKVYEKWGKLRRKSIYEERAKALAQDQIMEEALTIYKEVGHGS